MFLESSKSCGFCYYITLSRIVHCQFFCINCVVTLLILTLTGSEPRHARLL